MNGHEAIGRNYWAMRSRDRLGTAVRDTFVRYQRDLQQGGWAHRISSSWLRYHGFDADGGPATSADVLPGGEQGELDLVQANHYRSLIRSMLSIATSSRPAYRAAATDDSADSMAACYLAEQVWEHELERGMEAVARESGERMLVESESGVLVVWDPEAGPVVAGEPIYEYDDDGQPVMDEAVTGEEVDPVTGQPRPVVELQPREIDKRPIHAGDLVYEALGPRDIARDTQARNLRDLRWVIVRRVMSRWDLCALYQDDESVRAITGAEGPPYSGSDDRSGETAREGDDQCYVLELYHDRTPAVPGGRYARVVGDHVLEEGELPYTCLPIVLKSPSAVIGRALGYTDAWDLLGIAKLMDAAISEMSSTANRHGQRPVLMPEGADIEASDLLGPGVITAPVDPASGRMVEPKWMDVPEVPKSALDWVEFLQGQMQVLSGVNSVVRGDPEASLKSGAALALVQAMAVQHNSAFQASYAEMLRDLATLVIDLYRENAHAERTIDIVGDDERGSVRKFVGSDLDAVRRVRAELANPLMRTVAGKKELADFYADPARWPDDPPLTRNQHMAFIESGRLDPLFRAARSEAIGIKAECEALTRGEPVPVLVTDNHETHIREHKAILDGKQRLQLSPEAIAVVSQHIQEHVRQWVQLTVGNPSLLMATGQKPAQVAMPMGPPGTPPGTPPGGPGGAPPGPEAPQPPGGEGPPLGPPQPGVMGESPIPGGGVAEAEMPQAPINPATGERVQLPAGAMQ